MSDTITEQGKKLRALYPGDEGRQTLVEMFMSGVDLAGTFTESFQNQYGLEELTVADISSWLKTDQELEAAIWEARTVGDTQSAGSALPLSQGSDGPDTIQDADANMEHVIDTGMEDDEANAAPEPDAEDTREDEDPTSGTAPSGRSGREAMKEHYSETSIRTRWLDHPPDAQVEDFSVYTQCFSNVSLSATFRGLRVVNYPHFAVSLNDAMQAKLSVLQQEHQHRLDKYRTPKPRAPKAPRRPGELPAFRFG